jgi:hypothetical protein
MVLQNDSERKLEQSNGSMPGGWTVVHSWIFLAIVAVGFTVIAWQNRYHYLSPLGLGKAYRIDKLFGGIQEFDPATGWVTAQLQTLLPQQAMSMMEPPPSLSQAVPMNMPGSVRQAGTPEAQVSGAPELRRDEPFVQDRDREIAKTQVAAQPPPISSTQNIPSEMGKEEKLMFFQKLFPEFGQDEFQLANDDLYPDWKNRIAPNGNWNQFLAVYKNFVQWWNDSGSPPEPGLKLWKDFLASGGGSK